MNRRWLVTLSHPVAIPLNGSTVMTNVLVVEAPLQNNEGKPLKELATNERWNLAHCNNLQALSLGDGRRFPKPLLIQVGGYQGVAFAVEMDGEDIA